MGVKVPKSVNSSRLKDNIHDLKAYNKAKEMMLAYEHNIADAQMFQSESTLDESLPPNCQKDFVPPSLMALVSMILEGPKIHDKSEQNCHANSVALALGQLLIFNSVNDTRVGEKTVRHAVERETPIALYTLLW